MVCNLSLQGDTDLTLGEAEHIFPLTPPFRKGGNPPGSYPPSGVILRTEPDVDVDVDGNILLTPYYSLGRRTVSGARRCAIG
jgi:hypothetical protein